jgi:hypothetical protein
MENSLVMSTLSCKHIANNPYCGTVSEHSDLFHNIFENPVTRQNGEITRQRPHNASNVSIRFGSRDPPEIKMKKKMI